MIGVRTEPSEERQSAVRRLCRDLDVELETAEACGDDLQILRHVLDVREQRLFGTIDGGSGADEAAAEGLRVLIRFAAHAAGESSGHASGVSAAQLDYARRLHEEIAELLGRHPDDATPIARALDATPVPLTIVSDDGTVRAVARSLEAEVGRSAATGVCVADWLPGWPLRPEEGTFESPMKCASGERRTVLVVVSRAGERWLASPLRPGTRPRQRAHALAGTLRVVRLLNHEINSPLTSIVGRLQMMLLVETELDPELRQTIETVSQAALRVGRLSRRMGQVAALGAAPPPADTDGSEGYGS